MKNNKNMDPVVHFEMPAVDRKRMSDFYTSVFGWKTKQMGKDMGEYVLVTTAESELDKDGEMTGRPKRPGAINGGFYLKTDDPMSQYPSIVVAVDDIKESMKKVEKAGGKVHGKPEMIPGVGQFVSIIDTEGNRISMLEPSGEMDM